MSYALLLYPLVLSKQKKVSMMSFLRLTQKDFEEINTDVPNIESDFSNLCDEARDFYNEIRKLKLVVRITYQTTPIKYKNICNYHPTELHIPYMFWTYYGSKNRDVIFDWKLISRQLDKANASLDERLLHIKIHLMMLSFWKRGRRLAECLRTAHILNNEMKKAIKYERINKNMLPSE